MKCTELSKKVEFGKNISRDLKKKLYELKKSQKESFGSLSNQDESRDSFIEPEKDELNSSMDHRESILTATDRNEAPPDPNDLSFGTKCKCLIYWSIVTLRYPHIITQYRITLPSAFSDYPHLLPPLSQAAIQGLLQKGGA